MEFEVVFEELNFISFSIVHTFQQPIPKLRDVYIAIAEPFSTFKRPTFLWTLESVLGGLSPSQLAAVQHTVVEASLWPLNYILARMSLVDNPKNQSILSYHANDRATRINEMLTSYTVVVLISVQHGSVLRGGQLSVVVVVAIHFEYEHVCKSKVQVPEGPGPGSVSMWVGQERGAIPVIVLIA